MPLRASVSKAMDDYKHLKRILIIEDDPRVVDILKYRLAKPDTFIASASTLEAAIEAIDSQHFNVFIVDLSLDTSLDNLDGIEVLKHLAKQENYPREIKNSVFRLVLTARDHNEDLLNKVRDDYYIDRYVRKNPNYEQRVADHIDAYFSDDNNRINFDLDYQDTWGELRAIGKDLAHIDSELNQLPVDKDALSLVLYHEILDILGRFFHDATSLEIEPMTPGMTASAVLKVRPLYDQIYGRRYVIKFGRRDKIQHELSNYYKYVARLLNEPVGLHPNGAIFRRHLAGLGYQLAINQNGDQVDEFDVLYKRGDIRHVNSSVKRLFEVTLSRWYFAPAKRERLSLIDAYAEALNLGGSKDLKNNEPPEPLDEGNFKQRVLRLYQAMGNLLPNQDLNGERIRVTLSNGHSREVTNPLQWLKDRIRVLKMPVEIRITHGDLTGRNIMADVGLTTHHNGFRIEDAPGEQPYHAMQLIDFYRTDQSHLLRDVVIFETDLKYRLYHRDSVPQVEEFLAIERTLLGSSEGYNFSDDAIRLINVVRNIHEISRRFHNGDKKEWQRHHRVALLLATLNITRFERMPVDRRKQAIISASMICDWLLEEDRHFHLPEGNTKIYRTTAQRVNRELDLEVLTEKLIAGKGLLFIGYNLPDSRDNERSLKKLAVRVAAQIPNYHPRDNTMVSQIFQRFEDEFGREALLEEYLLYFEAQTTIPDYMTEAAQLPWKHVYTTNQHNYFERALTNQRKPYQVITSSAWDAAPNGTVMLYKMCGSLTLPDPQDPQHLPITPTDYQLASNATRLNILHRDMWQRIDKAPDDPPNTNDNMLIMLFPSSLDTGYFEHNVRDKGSVGSRVYVIDDNPDAKYPSFNHLEDTAAMLLHHLAERCK